MRSPHDMDDDDPLLTPGPPIGRPHAETEEERAAREERGWHQVPGRPAGIEVNDATGRYRNNSSTPGAQ
jgi:hypothetical protein